MIDSRRWSRDDDSPANARTSSDDDNNSTVALPSLEPLASSAALLDPNEWDVDAFLLSRSDLPLDELRAELREYLIKLREELGELINDEYEEFISLGLGLRGEAEQLEEIRLPLQVLKNEVEVCLWWNSSLGQLILKSVHRRAFAQHSKMLKAVWKPSSPNDPRSGRKKQYWTC